MNNKLIIFSIGILLLFSCKQQNNQIVPISQSDSKLNNDSLLFKITNDTSQVISKIKTNQELNQVLPDTTINNKLALANYETLPLFYSEYKNIKTIDRIRESPVVIFSNKSNTEYLITYQYEGSTQNSFDCFEVGYFDDDKDLIKTYRLNTEELSFKSESNISLGMTLEQLQSIKGSNYDKIEKGNLNILTYRNTNFETSSFLKRYNMPSYFMEFTLKENKIQKMKFGFDYP